jgi:hypothetical protein
MLKLPDVLRTQRYNLKKKTKKQKLSRATTYMAHIVKQAIKIQLHPRNFKREAGFKLSRTWKPIINMLHKLTQHNTT